MSSMRGLRKRRCWGGAWRWLFATVALLTALLAGWPAARAASEAVPPAQQADTLDPKMRQLFELLGDPAVRRALEQARPDAMVDAPQTKGPAPSMTVSLASRLDLERQHVRDLLVSTRDFGTEARTVHGMAMSALKQWGFAAFFSALAAFVATGFAMQGVFHWVGKPVRRWLFGLPLETVDGRVRAVFGRSLYGLGLVASFALGSIGAFLLFDWPPLIQQVLLAYLIAFLLVRLANVAGRFLLAPSAERFRVVPLPTHTAWFLYLRLIVFVTVLAFGEATIDSLVHFGLSGLAAESGRDAIGLVLLVLVFEAVWRLRLPPHAPHDATRTHHRERSRALVLSCAALVMWICWLVQARTAFWIVAFVTGLPIVVATGRAAVLHVLRHHEAASAGEGVSLQALLFERGVRSFILIGAALVLAWVFGVDLASLTMQDTLTTRFVRAAVSVAVIGLSAEFLWTAIRAALDRKMREPLPHADASANAGHAARMQTLLPIVSNILLASLLIIAAMMILAAIGVQIGPLIASAGVVGVAIGFGAQTLVKDIISGIFYLVDDAFRIGEYIQGSNYKGTVEAFSLRSVKVRHQRGPLYTIPFGSLGAVQNQSRDWVVDKIAINVPYGTDLEKVRKLIKKIGTELTEDEEFGTRILSPLKMQGVAQFGDYAIQIQTKMMTRPGDVQFAMRRKALLLIKLAFEQNDIGFAMPTVQVAGEAATGSPAASAALSLSRRTTEGEALSAPE